MCLMCLQCVSCVSLKMCNSRRPCVADKVREGYRRVQTLLANKSVLLIGDSLMGYWFNAVKNVMKSAPDGGGSFNVKLIAKKGAAAWNRNYAVYDMYPPGTPGGSYG